MISKKQITQSFNLISSHNIKKTTVLICGKTIIFISILSFLSFTISNLSNSQLNDKTLLIQPIQYQKTILSNTKVLLEDFDLNKEHPYYNRFISNPDPDFIKGLYYLNKAYTIDINAEKAKFSKSRGKLIFTLVEDGKKSYDTLYNCLHPDKLNKNKIGNTIPVSGKLSNGIWSNLDNNPKGNTSIKMYLKEKSAHTKIDITHLDGKIITNLVDKHLEKGTYSYKWKPNSNLNGEFFMNIYTDQEKMTYLIDIE